ncbi:MAG: hypothetical protein NC293_06465 [Roseburia sp.]|nr:hypothetical protein [Roseburia sp.]
MKYFRKSIKLFLKTPQILLSYLLLLGVANIYLCKIFKAFLDEFKTAGALSTDSIYLYGDLRHICIVFFICWFFISFEAAKKFDSVKEIFVAMGNRSIIPYASQILVLVCGILLFTANVAAYAVIGYYFLECPSLVLWQMVKVLFVDVFLLSVASAGMGLLVSGIRVKFLGYAIFLFLVFYMIPDYYSIMQESLPFSHEIMEKFHRMLCILPQDVTYSYDALYGLPFERYRIMSMLFWFVLGSAVFIKVCFIRSKIGKMVMTGLYGVACLTLLLVGSNQGSVLRMDDELRHVTSYYAEHEGRVEEEDYEIKSYQINFEITNKLSAECRLYLQGNTNQKQYLFTLYHGYKVKYIRNGEGNRMDFKQEGDYITVYADAPVEYLDLYYSGSGDIFYSNTNACFLPGYFAYYPRSGFVEIFDTDNMVFSTRKEKKAEFDIGIKGKGKYIMNLPKEKERYKGNVENLTIINGNYEEIEEGVCKYIALPMQKSSYSLINAYKNNNFQKELMELQNFLDDDFSKMFVGTDCVIVIPNSTTFVTHTEVFYATDSYMLLSEQCRAYSILKDRVGKGTYESLKNIFFELEPGENFDVQNIEPHKNFISSERYTKRDELYDAVLDQMQTAGVKETARKIWKYISSDDYKENIDAELSFVRSI